MKLIVISAVNLRKGGTLTILQDCLHELSELAQRGEYRVVALVHRRYLADYPGIEYIEIPWSIRSWLHRLWCEHVTMHGISRQLGDIDLWLSLHDTTPRVKARCQAVYCHNSYPFFRWHWCHLWQNYRIVCFALFTRWIYRVNLHRNNFVIVQSQWFRDAFSQMTGFDKQRTIVFPPAAPPPTLPNKEGGGKSLSTFLYPAYPDVHKNIECLCEAAEALEREMGIGRFEVRLTIAPSTNRYSRWLHDKWGHVSSIRFCGFLSKERLNILYANTDCLVFPSCVETWGLPISEFSVTGRPMVLADLPYAHETAAGCQRVAFFDPNDPNKLKELMRDVLEGRTEHFKEVPDTPISYPFASDWKQIIASTASFQ